MLARPWRQGEVRSIDKRGEFGKACERLAGATRSAVCSCHSIDVGDRDQVQVGMAAAASAQLATTRPVLGDYHRSERVTDQYSHLFCRFAHSPELTRSCIRDSIDVRQGHE